MVIRRFFRFQEGGMFGVSSMNAGMQGMSQSMDKQMFGAQVVSKTLDYMNQNQHQNSCGGDAASYDFQKSVLGAAYSGIGAIMNVMT